MTVQTIEDLQGWNNQAILKFTRGSLFFADYSAAAVTDPFTYDAVKTAQATGLKSLPAGYHDPGYLTTDGVVFSRNITVGDVNSWQSQEPTNSTVETDIKTAKVTFQETNPITLALYDNLLLANAGDRSGTYAQASSATGSQPLRRAFFIAEAGDLSSPIWLVRFFPQVKITAIDDQSAQRTQELQFPYTFTAYKDKNYGSSMKTWVGGPGWNALQTAPAWQATTAYVVGSDVTLSGGQVLQCTTAGTSGSTEPVAPAAVGGTVTDGTVTWTRQS